MFDIICKGSFHFLRWLGLKGKPSAVRKPDGYTRTTGPYGEVVDADTLCCVHCRCHWEVVAGSGRLRGFCTRCCGYVCGQPECMECVPFEQRLENIEHGLPGGAVPLWTTFGELGPSRPVTDVSTDLPGEDLSS